MIIYLYIEFTDIQNSNLTFELYIGDLFLFLRRIDREMRGGGYGVILWGDFTN